MNPNLRRAYQKCTQIAKHYENFPTASRLLPKKLRPHVAAIYAFARTADDIADEGSHPKRKRMECLEAFLIKLKQIKAKEPVLDPIFIALENTIAEYHLPYAPFFDLLKAFKWDIEKSHFKDFAEISAYCHLSAHPIGLIMLHLNNAATIENIAKSNSICSALQLINFLQDIYADCTQRHRVYLPQDEMNTLNLTEKDLFKNDKKEQVNVLIQRQIQRASALLAQGSALPENLEGRFKLQIKLTLLSAQKIIEKLIARKNNLKKRPTLSKLGALILLGKALCSG